MPLAPRVAAYLFGRPVSKSHEPTTAGINNKSLKSPTIHRRLTWLVLVTAVPLIAFALGLVFWHSQTEQRALREQASRTASAAMQTVDRELAAVIAGLQVLAASPALAQGDFEGFHAQTQAAVGIAGNSVIILYDRDGNRLVSSAVPYGIPLPRRADMSAFSLPFATGKPHMTPLFISETVKQPTVGVIVPVTVGGEVKYVLGAGILSRRLSDLLLTSGLPREWVAALLDQQSTIIARTRKPDQFIGTKAVPEVWQRMEAVRGAVGTVEGVTKEGGPVTLTFARSDASGWLAVIGIPDAVLEGQLHTSLKLVAAAAAAVLLAASLLAWWAARQISHPATLLLAAAKALEEGREVRLAGTGVEQFDQLALAMEHAAGKIRQREASLYQSLDELGLAHRQLRDEHFKKDQFIATLAHELRNPLAPIRTGVHILGKSPPAAIASKTLALIDRQLGHMVRLIDDLLDVSRIARGNLTLQKEDVILQKVIADAADASEPLRGVRGQKLVRRLPDEPIWVNADPTRLTQVFTNILNNAAKFSPPGESIDLAATVIGEQLEVIVSDRGIGIPADKLEEIFELFSQVRDPKIVQQPGLGIGLSLSKRLVELHGGTIVASSDGPGRGAVLRVRLPISQGKQDESSVVPLHGSNGSPALRVLVVDDNEDAANMLATALRIAGHGAHVAHDGLSALQFAQDSVADLVILDIGMPGMNGYELCRRLRELPAYARIKIVALTGWGGLSDRQKSREAGFDAHLTKPVDWDQVEQVLYGRTDEVSGSA